MIDRNSLVLSLALCIAAAAQGQEATQQKPQTASKQRVAYFIDSTMLDPQLLLLPPSPVDSVANHAELDELHRIEATRTPDQIAKARADDAEEDMFAFRSVLGPSFNPESLPLTAALGAHVKNEQGVVGARLKSLFARPRPYQTDTTLHPVCKVTTAHNSYPSGHAMTGYLEALTLAQIVPEKRDELLARANEYAYERLVCGVHYRSDIEASRSVAYAVFGYMLATPRFQHDLAAARLEIRGKLGLPPE